MVSNDLTWSVMALFYLIFNTNSRCITCMRRDVDSVKWFELGIYGSPVAATGGPYHLFMALKLGMHAQRIANVKCSNAHCVAR